MLLIRYIKWFTDKLGLDGLHNLVHSIALWCVPRFPLTVTPKLAAYEDKSAYAQCMIAVTAGPGEPVHVFAGRTDGMVLHGVCIASIPYTLALLPIAGAIARPDGLCMECGGWKHKTSACKKATDFFVNPRSWR